MPVQKSNRKGKLTPREREVMDLLMTGIRDREISQLLGCSEGTVRKHLQQVYRKLGVRSRIGAVLVWLRE